ncbi:glycerol-3-phosphate responsive antiterminator [Cohnella sp. LGH]|uniref:Glycerol uptake operon antiterminator regulatory protein n=1 Tax=Cohnella phaseoli TaxID=456490 RepID=A0A3D9JNL0_9BACL|nr:MULTISPECIES: glycerol-3-phosphate responsive antiterminator [Cohnella]QTH40026.1 glycerol-3-phosphate responsive antiterminator [Cohnella sp. LGH]RED75399.1 glycerol uptake operon antiterminator [Cohnella phaseoli]
MSLLHLLAGRPVIAALRTSDELDIALSSRVDHLFFMGGSLTDVIHGVRLAREQGKGAFVHLDLIRGLSSTDRESVEFVRDFVGANGIVTPKSHLIKEAKQAGLYAVLHLFVLDSLALANGLKMAQTMKPDAVELMPGVIPKVVSAFADALPDIPLIASGLIQTEDEANGILDAGATALSVSERALWNFEYGK